METLPQAIEFMFMLAFLVLGCSHAMTAQAWVDFFARLREQGEAGIFTVAFITLIPGLLIVSFHPVWTGIPIVLTLIGWGYVLKGAVYFVWPKVGLMVLAKPSAQSPAHVRIAGVIMIVLAAALGLSLLTGW